MIPFIMTNDALGQTLTLVVNSKPHTIGSDHINYNKILNELKTDGDVDTIINLLNIPLAVKQFLGNSSSFLDFDLDNYKIYYKGEEVHSMLVDKIYMMLSMGFKIDSMVNFMKNLYDNPSQRAIDELYGFLEFGKLPITEDGYFLAYKRVRLDYKSIHDGKTDNSIGSIVEMPRTKVNDNSNETCSTGLHLCSFDYLKDFDGDRIVIVKVNPRDVVSIPTDYNNTKARACKYEIIGEVTEIVKEVNKPVLPQVVASNKTEFYDINKSTSGKSTIQQLMDNFNKTLDDDLPDSNLNNLGNGKATKSPYVPIKPDTEVNTPVQTILKFYTNDISGFYKAAYTIGYNHGKCKQSKDINEVLVGEVVQIANYTDHVLTQVEADEINNGYEAGYKHGKGHKKREYPNFNYTDIEV